MFQGWELLSSHLAVWEAGAAHRESERYMESSELAVIGLTCNLVGVFFLANSITFRRSRRELEDFFGKGTGTLAKVRDYALNRMQVVIGFLFLNVGFLLQIVPRWGGVTNQVSTLTICLSIIAASVLVYAIGFYYSRRSFKRLLREFFKKHEWSFTENMALTKEIGLFLGVEHTSDMTVEDYLHKVLTVLGVKGVKPSTGEKEAESTRQRRIRSISPLPGR